MIYIGSFFFKTGSAVSGADEDAVDRGGRGKFPDESVFSATTAEDEDAKGHGRGLFWDTDRFGDRAFPME